MTVELRQRRDLACVNAAGVSITQAGMMETVLSAVGGGKGGGGHLQDRMECSNGDKIHVSLSRRVGVVAKT